MPRTPINAITPIGPYPTLPLTANSADVVETVADPVNGSQVAFGTSSEMLVIAHNTHATNPYTVSITSSPDGLNRTGDITGYTLQATEFAAFKVARSGWRQSDGNVYLTAENAAVKFMIFKI